MLLLTHRPHRRPQRGLTLIELVVVMTILIALAGLLIPMFGSMLTRGHTSTCSTNMGEVSKAVEQYQMLYGAYPNNMDSLTGGGTLITYLAGGSSLPTQYTTSTTVAGGGQLISGTLSATEIQAMNNAGIFNVQPMATVPVDPTFQYYPTGSTPTTNSTSIGSTPVAILDPAAGGVGSAAYAICVKLNLSLTGRYAVLGVGQNCDMIGKTMAAAPVHYGDTPALNPEYGYERICAIFKVSDSALTSFTTAQFVGAAPIHDDGIGSINDELQNWYQLEVNDS